MATLAPSMSVDHLHWRGLGTSPGLEIDVNSHILEGHHASHDHDFVEIALVLDGAGLHQTLYERRALARGDAFVIRPGAWHAFRDCRRLRVVNCCFQPHLLDRELLWLAEEPRLRLLLWPGTSIGGGIVHVKLLPAGLEVASDTLGRLTTPPAELEKLAGYGRDIAKSRAEAKRLLKEAGIPEGYAFTFKNRGIPHPYEPIGIWLVDQWRQIGVTAEHKQFDTAPYLATMNAGNHDVAIDFSNLFMDEPSLGLSPKYVALIFEKLVEMKRGGYALTAGCATATTARSRRISKAKLMRSECVTSPTKTSVS